MSFIRPKKIVFCNNKGGVGKTTLLFNIASEMSKQGTRVAMVDLDPQCNLTMNVVGEENSEDVFNGNTQNIHDVLKNLEAGTGDIDINVKPYIVTENQLYLIPGSLALSSFEDNVMNTAFLETTSGIERGFRITSAINRYLDKVAFDYNIDLFLIDTSPNLGVLNKVAILSTDFFVVPVNPNIFSVQGVQHIGKTFVKWKNDWKAIQSVSGKSYPVELVLRSDPVFLGWILNNYTPYSSNPAKLQQLYIDKLKQAVSGNLSSCLTKNGLFTITQDYLGKIQQFGTLMQRTHERALAVVNMQEENIKVLPPGSKEVYDHVKKEIEDTSNVIMQLAQKYQNS